MVDDLSSQQVMAAERERCRALAEDDLAALGDLLADGYRHVHGNGTVERRAEYLARLSGGGPRRTERSELAVEVHGEVATMSGLAVTTVDPRPGVAGLRVAGRALQVWRHEPPGWRLLAFQMTPTEPPQELTA